MKRAIVATLTAAATFLSTTAYGQISPNLTVHQTGRAGVFTISIEALSNQSDRTITVDGVTYHSLYDRDLPVTSSNRVNGASGRQVFFRLDFENMVFFRAGGSPVRGLVLIGATPHTHTLEAGGTNGSNYAVLSAPANLAYTVDNPNVGIVIYIHAGIRPDALGAITYSEYIDVGDALLGQDPLHTATRTVIFPVRSLQDEVTPGAATATVASNFTQLAAAGANPLGTLNIAVGDDRPGYGHYGTNAVRDASRWITSAINNLSWIAQAGSVMTFRGDFSVGSFYANTAAVASCGTTPLTTRDQNNAVLDKVTFSVAEGVTSFCVSVPANNAAEIPEGQYTVEVDYEAYTNRAYPPIDLAETSIGRIRRDGTRVQIPFLTTYSGYSQRVVIVNRNTKPVSYAFAFNSEDGVTATPGEAAEGTLPAQGRAVLRTADIVTLEGGKTRTAATLDVVAASGTIDVATTTVNMEDKGTDTVVLESVAN